MMASPRKFDQRGQMVHQILERSRTPEQPRQGLGQNAHLRRAIRVRFWGPRLREAASTAAPSFTQRFPQISERPIGRIRIIHKRPIPRRAQMARGMGDGAPQALKRRVDDGLHIGFQGAALYPPQLK